MDDLSRSLANVRGPAVDARFRLFANVEVY